LRVGRGVKTPPYTQILAVDKFLSTVAGRKHLAEKETMADDELQRQPTKRNYALQAFFTNLRTDELVCHYWG
jgi:hypothetical protein